MPQRGAFTTAEYLGHVNTKNALDRILNIFEQRAITTPDLDDEVGPSTNLIINNAFEFRIADTIYARAAGSVNPTGANLPSGSSLTVTAGSYRAVAVCINAAGTVLFYPGTEGTSKSAAIIGLTGAAVPATVAVIGFLVIGDGTNLWTGGSDNLDAGTNADFYSVGAAALSAGKSSDATDMIAGL